MENPEIFDPNKTNPVNEQSLNGERKIAESNFATQLQQRVWKLAQCNNDTTLTYGFGLHSDDDINEYGISVNKKMLGDDSVEISFNYGGVEGRLKTQQGVVMDIAAHTYNDPEAHLIDWDEIARQEGIPDAARIIATRMHEYVTSPESINAIDKQDIINLSDKILETVKTVGLPILYRSHLTVQTYMGEVSVDVMSDTPNDEGNFLPDDSKFYSNITISGLDFSYYRDISPDNKSETFYEKINFDDLLPLTDEQRKSHPYVVIPATRGIPSHLSETQYPKDSYTVISAAVSGAVTVTFQMWHDTFEEAQKYADQLYAHELATQLSEPHNITPERQRSIISAIDLALEATEFQIPE